MGLIFTYLLTYGGSVLSLFSPYVGLLIYICFAIIRPEALWHWSVPAGNYSRIIVVCLLVGWGLNCFGNWNLGRAKSIILFLLAYLAWAVVSISQASVQPIAQDWVESQAKIVLPVLVGITILDTVSKLKGLAWTILLSQGYVAYDLNRSYFEGFNRLLEMGFGGMDNNCIGISLVTCVGLGGFLFLGSSALWQKLLSLICVACMIHAILFSFSRGAMLGLILVAVISFVLIPKRISHYIMFALAIAGTLAVAGPEVIKRFSSSFADEKTRDGSAESRVEMWSICLKIIVDKPILGLGPKHFPVHASSFGLTPNKEAHTLWLQLGAELGIPGLAFLLLFYLTCIYRLAQLLLLHEWETDPWIRNTARMVVASLIGFVFTAQFVSLPGLEVPFYIVLLGAGALKVHDLMRNETFVGPSGLRQI